jgi:DNA-binding response OmpR family regulator
MTRLRNGEGPPIANRHILIVEDEMMIAMLLEDLLRSYGCRVVGPVSRVKTAVDLASSEPIDAAILDLNVAGEVVYPVADALAARGIPFLFVTGYQTSAISPTYQGRPTLQKPFKPQALKQTLHAILT